MIQLLREKFDENSEFKPYIDILPQSFEEHPLLWTDEDFQYSSNTGLEEFTKSRLHAVKISYNHILNTLIAVSRNAIVC